MGPRGMWIIFPTIMIFGFAAWVFYSVLEDVSGRPFYDDDLFSRCVEGCQPVPAGTISSNANTD
jgi:hypothetical protein